MCLRCDSVVTPLCQIIRCDQVSRSSGVCELTACHLSKVTALAETRHFSPAEPGTLLASTTERRARQVGGGARDVPPVIAAHPAVRAPPTER